MSVLDHNYDTNVSLSNFWDIKVMEYKYGSREYIEDKIREKTEDIKWLKVVEESWDHYELVELLKEMMPTQATNLSSLRSWQEVYTESHFIIYISNASGQVLKVKFTKKK